MTVPSHKIVLLATPTLAAAHATSDEAVALTVATWTLAVFVFLLWVCVVAMSQSRLQPRFPLLLFVLALFFPPLLPLIFLWVCLVPPPVVVVQSQPVQPVPRSRAQIVSNV